MEDDLRKQDEREREMEAAHLSQSPKAMGRLEAEADEIIAPEERIRLRAEHEQRMQNPEFRESFESTTEEERAAFIAETLRILEKNREQWERVDFGGRTLVETIAELKDKQARLETLAKIQDESDEQIYETAADLGQNQARQSRRLCEWMATAESLTEAEWAAMAVADRNALQGVLAQWRSGLREKCLALLPIEQRRKFEQGG